LGSRSVIFSLPYLGTVKSECGHHERKYLYDQLFSTGPKDVELQAKGASGPLCTSYACYAAVCLDCGLDWDIPGSTQMACCLVWRTVNLGPTH
jgi:hypothetical protein